MTAPTLDAVPVLGASEVIDRVRSVRSLRDDADRDILKLAASWADLHVVDPRGNGVQAPSWLDPRPPTLPTDEELEWVGLPTLRWDTAASFAAALGLSTAGGKALIRDVLVLRHRLPRVWARLLSGEVQAWRARRIAQAVLGEPDDVATYVDQEAAPRAHEIGPVVLDRLLEEALLTLHAEELELAQCDELDQRYVQLDENSINHTGVARMEVRGDWADLAAFDDTVADVAEALKRDGSRESLDARRSMALGVLADPERAHRLLTTGEDRTSRHHRADLVVHLTEANLTGAEPVAHHADGTAVLDQVIRIWCGRPDTQIRVRPAIHCGGCPTCTHEVGHDRLDRYPLTDLDREILGIVEQHCVFPFCSRPARACDGDHVIPFDAEHPERGPTCACNLAPLCRHHHRLKTHAAWRYTRIEAGTYLWSDRFGQQFLRTSGGTVDVARSRPG